MRRPLVKYDFAIAPYICGKFIFFFYHCRGRKEGNGGRGVVRGGEAGRREREEE
jgi:hypothetical protein